MIKIFLKNTNNEAINTLKPLYSEVCLLINKNEQPSIATSPDNLDKISKLCNIDRFIVFNDVHLTNWIVTGEIRKHQTYGRTDYVSSSTL